MNDDELIKKCLDKWGKDAQIKKTIEELAELIVALSKWDHTDNDTQILEIAGEVADVELMIKQLNYIIELTSLDYTKDITRMRTYKRERLSMRLESDYI